MENHRNMEAIINGEIQLPEVIIQRIQSFLTPRQSARTTSLSKSWYNAWLTRPDLAFDERAFRKNDNKPAVDALLEFAKKIIQRYEESNLKIESFRFRMEVDHPQLVLVNELIAKALKMGSVDLSFKLEVIYLRFFLPDEVFGSENRVRLSMEGCKIDLGMDPKVRCLRLEYLSLTTVELSESDVISNILSSCPLIKTLSLKNVYTRGVASVVDSPINLHNLRCLVLVSLKIDTLFSPDFLCHFPNLKDLTVNNCWSQEDMQIFSQSVERLNLMDRYSLSVKINVPSIRKLTFVGSAIPSVSLESTSREWESHVSISDDCLSSLWFCDLNKLLTELSSSKIYLSLLISGYKSFNYDVRDIQCLPKPEVENLTIDVNHLPSLSCYAFFDGLFRSCRPKFISQYWLSGKSNCDFLFKTLVREMNYKCWIPSRFMYGLHDLKEVNIEIFEKSVAEWRSLPLKSLLDSSSSLKHKQEVRLQLKWRP